MQTLLHILKEKNIDDIPTIKEFTQYYALGIPISISWIKLKIVEYISIIISISS
jgi:hypothetical protein